MGELTDLLLVIADVDRRDVLRRLRARNGAVTSLYSLAADGPTHEPGSMEQRARRLHHVTLPKLAAADLVHYDQEARTVEYRGSDALEAWLDLIDEPGP